MLTPSQDTVISAAQPGYCIEGPAKQAVAVNRGVCATVVPVHVKAALLRQVVKFARPYFSVASTDVKKIHF